jgi:hypothetical protein
VLARATLVCKTTVREQHLHRLKGNSTKSKAIGFSFKVAFDEQYQGEYNDLVRVGGR